MYADINNLDTWSRYKSGMCRDCVSACCTMPVEVKLSDLIRLGIADEFELGEPIKSVAKRLMKDGIVQHFNFKSGRFTLAQRINGDCLYLDAKSRLCTVYEQRPDTCRNHPQIGPKPGYCAFTPTPQRR
ncbi:YkgJ family cysteine cluster protein [Crenobacter cavernae]|nr:YkgJ family cysteine cluster protein [Crenobacter cavernae]